MLDLTKLARQMQGISQHLNAELTASQLRLERAERVLLEAKVQQSALVERSQEWRDRLTFTAAEPMEPLDTRIPIAVAPGVHTVLATDGSQIAPSHHEIAYCYLINVGRVVLHYGQNRYPLLDSQPEVFYRPEDLYASRQWGIRTEEWMGYRRTVSESVVLAELGTQFHREMNPLQPRQLSLALNPLPSTAIAMVDGSLVHWFLEQLPHDARDRILPPILEAWERLRTVGIPLIGYISASRSGESLNFLRLHTCPYSTPDCLTHCPGKTEDAPCQILTPLRDTALWSLLLQPGERSALWRSSAKILETYGPHHVYFCYVNVGAEIARIELPAWVAEDAQRLNDALSLTLAQVQKGYGYPVALAEAHNQAVVRSSDRARFFALLEREMIRSGLRNIGTSYKEARKRGSIA